MILMMMMMIIISPFGQLGLWAPSSEVEMYSHKSCMFSHHPVIEESGHPRDGQEAPAVDNRQFVLLMWFGAGHKG
jgi:hypothetical protein